MTGQFSPIPNLKSLGWLACLVAAAFTLSGCETQKKNVAAQAPSASELSFDSGAMVRVGDRLRTAGDYMAALHMYQEVRRRDPKNVSALLGEGEILLTLGAFPEAEQRFRTARSLGDASARSAAGLGGALLRQNKPGEALSFFEKALEEPDTSGQIYNGYGITLDLLGRHGDAQIAYGKGLDQSPGNVILTNNLALSFALSQDYAAALRILSDMVSARPNAKDARDNLSLVYGLSGDMDAAGKVAALDFKGAALDKRIGYIQRIAALPADVRGEAIILGIEPDVVVAADTPSTPAEGNQKRAPIAPAEAAAMDATAPPTSSQTAGSQAARSQAEQTAPQSPSESQPEPDPILATEPVYMVQLGSYLDDVHARAGWAKLKKRAPRVLGGVEPGYESATVAGDDGPRSIVRLGVKVMDGYAAADALCKALKASGVDCLVRRAVKAPAPEAGNGGSGTP